jgi:putative sterol carrier protein
MALEVFTTPWTETWAERLNSSSTFRSAAASWEGGLVLEMRGEGERRAVFADLWHGECRAARLAGADDHAQARFVISAEASTWKRLLEDRLDILFAVMTGKLRLERGSPAELLPLAEAAKELVAAARFEATFPAGWV